MTADRPVDRFLVVFDECADRILDRTATPADCVEAHPGFRPWLAAMLPLISALGARHCEGGAFGEGLDRAQFLELISNIPQRPAHPKARCLSLRRLLPALAGLAHSCCSQGRCHNY